MTDETRTDQPGGCPFPTPVRRKPLAQKRAERKARRAQRWGERVQAAEQSEGPSVAAVQFDWARAAFTRLDGSARQRAWDALAEAIARVREEYAQ